MIKYTSVDDVYLHDDLVSDPAIKQGLIERAVSGAEGYQVMPDDNGVMGAYAVSPDGKHIPLGKVDDILLADAGNGVVTDAPTGVRVGRAGITPAQSAKAGGLDRPLIALLDTLAGALQGATAQTIGLPGDIRSILDLISKDGAQKYLGDAVMPTTERMQEILPAVIPDGVANQKDREHTAKVFSDVGTFLPAPGLPEAIKPAAKLIKGAVKMTEGLPVGASITDVSKGVDDLGFYSAAAKAVDEIQQPKGTGDQFLKQIEKTPGVKPDEIKWTGLDEFLKSKKSVTKAEVQEYLAKNRVEVKEVQLGDIQVNEKSEYALPEVLNVIRENQGTDFDRIRLALVNDYKAYNALIKKFPNLEDTDNWQDRILEDIIGSDGGGGPKFSKYTLPGGENYREVLLTLPNKTLDRNSPEMIKAATESYGENSLSRLSDAQWGLISNRLQNSPQFKSNHFDQPNILAHLRVNDRIDAEGKKVLMVEEVQSDWHQAGRKQGYKDPAIKDEYQALEKELMAVNREALPYTSKGEDAPQNLIEKKVALSERMDALDKKYNNGVPDGPFKTTWQELAMKRAIQMAAEGGYDRIAFTTGKTQAERFDLSKQIDEIRWSKAKDGTYGVNAMRDGDSVISQNKLSIEQVEELIGKDIAKKIEEGSADRFFGALKDVDLQFGGEGMAGFYDNILPKFLDKYSKKWEAKTGMTSINAGEKGGDAFEVVLPNGKVVSSYASKKQADSSAKSFEGAVVRPIDNGEPVHYIDITPKMRESVVTKGQPMFAIGAGGAGAGAATQQNQEKK